MPRRRSANNSNEITADLFKVTLEEIKKINLKFDTLLAIVKDELIPRIQFLEEENSALKRKVSEEKLRMDTLENRLDDIEQDKRSHQLLISSPELADPKTSINETVELLSSKLHIRKEQFNGATVRKLGKQGNTVLLSLPNRHLHPIIFKRVRNYKPRNLFVNEFLIKKREAIYLYLKEQKKQDPSIFHSSFTFYGKIYIKKHANSEKILVQSINEAEIMCSKE